VDEDLFSHLKKLVENAIAKPNLRVPAIEVKDIFNGIAARIDNRATDLLSQV
jgi:hypothetical protein